MKELHVEDYCLSCEHILEELGHTFKSHTLHKGLPTSLDIKYCKRCGAPLEPALEQIKNDFNTFVTALNNKKLKVVAFVAPSVRTAIGECFNYPYDCQQKIVTALKILGCSDVYSMNFGADLTIAEESKEFAARLKNGQNLPLITSCCPAWVNYVTKLYPAVSCNLSTCKSPQQMMGAIINNYYCKVNNLKQTDIFVVSIVPCLAKKVERLTNGINSGVGYDVDACVTTTELAELIKDRQIDFINLKDTEFDNLFKNYSGTASAFGTSGGVSEAIILNLDRNAEFQTLQTSPYTVKEVVINGKKLLIASVQGVINAKPILDQISAGTSPYSLVEVMACTGGCIGGAGQPKTTVENLENRKKILQNSKSQGVLTTNQNTMVTDLYKTYLTEELCEHFFHIKR